MDLELSINGVIESFAIAPNESLLTLLRREGHTSVKQGCETGECGACTVLVEGVPRPGCVMLAAQAGGCSLMTAENLSSHGQLHPLQTAFVEVGAVQCGFCTPGMLLSAYALLKSNPSPGESEVRDALSGNLCRCSGYEKPVQAVLRAAAVMRGEKAVAPVYKTISADHEQGGPRGKLLNVLAGSAASAASSTSKIPVITPALLNAQNGAATRATPEPQFQVVGQAIPAINALKLVSGKAAYAGDFRQRGMLYARILTSPHAHALIRSIDVAQARALPGVHAVLTYKDVPRVPYSSVEQTPTDTPLKDRFCLDYIMRYVGDRVAVVAAETAEVAEQALGLIDVEYEVLPVLLDPRQALDAKAPVLHSEDDAQGIHDASRNIAGRVHVEIGEVEHGFASADLLVEGEYVLAPTQAAPLENQAVVTYFDADDYLIVRTNSQIPQYVQRTLAQISDLPARRIRVIIPDSGGMGSKQELLLEDLCALLTIHTLRPVLLTHTRAEEFQSRVRPQHILRIKTGVMRDGTIIANQVVLLAATGAHGTHTLLTRRNALTSALSLYPCVHMRFVAEVLYTNHAPAGAWHENGLLQEFFALESHMDEIASQLGIDALALRRKNWIRAGDAYPLFRAGLSGKELAPVVESCGLSACLQIVEEKLNWTTKRAMHGQVYSGRFRRGVGLALAMHGNAGGLLDASGALIKLNADGSFDIFVGIYDGGRGSATMIAQIAAEVLGVAVSDITLHTSDTNSVPYISGTGDEAALYKAGGAVSKAAEQIRRQILAVAGRMLNALPEALKVNNSTITAPQGQQVTIAQVGAQAISVESRQIMSSASWKMQQMPTSFAAQGVEVEVDTETGFIRVLSAITAVDAGCVINPMLVEGQIQGSVAQALGAALTEELFYDQKGTPLTSDLSSYRIYAAPDMPELQTYLIETAESASPFGAKAVLTVPLYGIAPAIANAVADALGIRIRQAPLTPERILRALHAAQTGRKPG